jgi:aminoacylase
MVAGEHPAVSAFRKYIQIKTVHPKPDYAGAVNFLRKEAQDAGLLFRTHECVPGKPFAIMTWEGTQPELPSLMLNSHIDVVPVEVCQDCLWHCWPAAALGPQHVF